MDIDLDGGSDPWRPARRLNLNQLYTLDAILKARTLTEAGRMVALSQPAMSMALRKLRDNFGDELVVYGGGDRQLTALGEALRPRIGHALRVADDAFNLSLDFDPATARRSIAIAAPEAIELLFLAPVVRAVLAQSPGIDVRMLPFDYDSVGDMFDRGVDVAIVPEEMADPRLESLPLFDLSVSGLVWEKNTQVGDTLSIDEYVEARHAALFPDIERKTLFGPAADPLLGQRRIVVRTGLFSMLPNLVVETDLVATLNSWMAQYYGYLLPVRAVSLPLRTPPTQLIAQWQPHRTREPVIRWLLDHIVDGIYWRT